MRFHVVGLPHTVTSKEYCGCAYTQKVLNFCKMMRSLGHTVFHYGAEGAEVDADHVTICTQDWQESFFGKKDFTKNFKVEWDPTKEYWQSQNELAALAIMKRAQPHDFVCIIGGSCQKPLTDQLSGELAVVEYGVGYFGVYSRYRVFESYSHQSAVYGRQSVLDRKGDPDIQLYDAVIPNYYDPNDFPAELTSVRREDYLLFVGRLIQRKGVSIAVEVAKKTGRKLKLAGQGISAETPTAYVTEDGQILPKDVCEYVGYASVAQRAVLMSRAHALLAPTTYLEPFGGVAVEAQLCGTIPITTDFGGFTETVKHAYTGWRCHTLSQFVQAVDTKPEASRGEIRDYAIANYSIDRIRHSFHGYFNMIDSLWRQGWYEVLPGEAQLHWNIQHPPALKQFVAGKH